MKKITKTSVAAGVAMAFAAPMASAAIVDVDVTGVESWDGLGDSDNTVLVVDMAAALGLASGSSVTVTGIGWDVVMSSVGASWLSEMDVDVAGEIALGISATGAPGTAEANSSGGIVDLGDDAGLPDIVLSDGLLTLEFYESYDDIADTVDGIWDSGFLSFEADATVVPVPAALPLFMTALGGLLFGSRRRRQS